ncbi:MAG: hypothetical protein AAFZ17_20920, partial [Cyanobacteria bacterium J06650_10]
MISPQPASLQSPLSKLNLKRIRLRLASGCTLSSITTLSVLMLVQYPLRAAEPETLELPTIVSPVAEPESIPSQ